jgi:hypothetical protein
LQPAHVVVGPVQELRPAARVPELLQDKLQQRQVPRLIAHIVEDALDQARLEAEANFRGGLLDGALEFLSRHRAEIDLRTLEPVGERAVGQRVAHEIAAEGDDHRQGRALGCVKEFVHEPAADGIVFGERVEFLPLVGHEQEALGAGLLVENAADHVAKGHMALGDGSSELAYFDEAVRLGHGRLEQRQ